MNSLTTSVVLIFIIIEHTHISSVKLVFKSQGFMGARTAVTMILVVENLFGSAAVAPFCDEVIGHFESGTLPIPEIQSSSGTARLYHLYHISYILYHITCISVPRTIFGKLVSSFAALSPHSIGPCLLYTSPSPRD